MFRHAFARVRVLGGANMAAIASLLGHANIESSGIYTRLYGTHLKDAYSRFMPQPEKLDDSGPPQIYDTGWQRIENAGERGEQESN